MYFCVTVVGAVGFWLGVRGMMAMALSPPAVTGCPDDFLVDEIALRLANQNAMIATLRGDSMSHHPGARTDLLMIPYEEARRIVAEWRACR